MSNTYESEEIDVDNGYDHTYTVPEDHVNLTNARGRWKGQSVNDVKTEDFEVTVNNEHTSGSEFTLDDGEWSNWFSLETDGLGFDTGENIFEHSIGGSGEAVFEFEYEWGYESPNPITFQRVHVNTVTYDLPLVDKNDDALEYSNLRYSVNNEVLAADLVDPSDDDASPYRVYIPNHGILAWREDIS